jgi:hypothetical protein
MDILSITDFDKIQRHDLCGIYNITESGSTGSKDWNFVISYMINTYKTMSHGIRCLSPLLVMLAVLSAGCNDVQNNHSGYEKFVSRSPLSGYNPFFVFDHPSNIQRSVDNGSVNSEGFFRDRWPSSGAGAIVENGEAMSYNEDFYSDQYVDGNNNPYQYYHLRQSGSRQTSGYR